MHNGQHNKYDILACYLLSQDLLGGIKIGKTTCATIAGCIFITDETIAKY